MLRAHRQAAISQGFQIFSNRALMHLKAELVFQSITQIHPAPSHNAVNSWIRTFLQKCHQALPLFLTKRTFVAAGAPFAKPRNAFVIVAMHPVPQSLAVHAARLSSRATIRSLKYQRNRKHTSHDQRLLLPLRQPAQISNRQIVPRHFHRHQSPPSQQ